MKYPGYPSYKVAPAPWLGQIPAHWTTQPLWSMFHREKTVGMPDEELLSVFRDYGVIPKSQRENLNKTAENRDIYQLVDKGWLVTNRMKAWQGSVGISPQRGIVSGHYIVFRPLHQASHNFLNLLMRSDVYTLGYQTLSRGVRPGQAEIDNDQYRTMPVIVPPRSEQDAIVDWVLAEIAQIDELIGKQNALIELLGERRTAVVTRAVTRGLGSSPVRGSSLEELNEIPAAWEERPFLSCFSGRVDYRGATPAKTETGIPLVTARNVKQGWIDYSLSEEFVSADNYADIMRRGLPEIGDVLMTMEAPLGNVALVDRTDVAFAQRVVKFRPRRASVDPDFICFAMNSEYFQNQLAKRATGSTALGIKASKLHGLRFALPPLIEQRAIAASLRHADGRSDAVAAKARAAIALLQERRAALITAAVTGKIDVRVAA